MVEKKRHGRKLLVASIGVAAVSYVACGGRSGNMTDVVVEIATSDAFRYARWVTVR